MPSTAMFTEPALPADRKDEPRYSVLACEEGQWSYHAQSCNTQKAIAAVDNLLQCGYDRDISIRVYQLEPYVSDFYFPGEHDPWDWTPTIKAKQMTMFSED